MIEVDFENFDDKYILHEFTKLKIFLFRVKKRELFIEPLAPFLKKVTEIMKKNPRFEGDFNHIYTGKTVETLEIKVKETLEGIELEAGFTTPYAEQFVTGQPPRNVELDALVRWHIKKFDIGEREAISSAKSLRKKILSEGSDPYPVIEDAWELYEDTYYDRVEKRLKRMFG